ncbi:MAG: protein translocase subunit SecF [Chloroflexi bacterium]|jgi:preprotein translocase subunit SecF|nr:protein translocase subunit SecF [Chloroflexota bacterium]MBT7082452.1 protein translocase subunit SecF [Chloroflexota bacterium]MBT7290035.1 protein translocase subunit SecF [Chloroflexota bacterium]
MIDFVKKRKWYFSISGILLLAGIISLSTTGLNLGIDFVSGSTITIDFKEDVDQSELRSILTKLNHEDAFIQQAGDDPSTDEIEDYIYIRTRELALSEQGQLSEKDELIKTLKKTYADLEEISFDSISPVIAAGVVRAAGFAVLAAIIGILLYVTWAFRKLPKPFHYGVCALIALFHDMFIMIGIFSILGWVANVEVSSMFIIATLTILGYSVNDTIVVFDRIRENLLKDEHRSFTSTVNISINESMGRSLATSVTTLTVLLALYLFGGSTISTFVLALMIGVISGTYSSIFIASQILVAWEEGTFGRIYRKVKGRFGKGETVTISGDDQQA